jgi:plasmid replication initiation protein
MMEKNSTPRPTSMQAQKRSTTTKVLNANRFERWQDLRRFALERAVAEINQLAGFTVAFRAIKRGRRIVSVELAWGKKEQADLIEAQRELDRPS